MSLQEETEVTTSVQAQAPVQRKLGLALLVIATAQLMLVLDNTITAVALPSIQNALHLSVSNLNWVITAYALAFGGLLLVGGRAGDLFGHRRMFRIGLVVFTLASLIGGFSPTGGILIASRVLQGVGAAISAPAALSLLATTFPAGPARNKALGVYGAMGGLGSVLGLLLGGALTEYLNWRWVLFINVPIAILVLAGTGSLVDSGRSRGGVDVPGAITATLGLGSGVYAINNAASNGWGDGVTITFLIAAVVLLTVFAFIQRRSPVAMMPPRVVADKARASANLVMFLMGAGMFAAFYFLTLYMQVVKGFSAIQTGLAFLPFAIGMGLGAGGIGPKLLAKSSARAVTGTGLVLAIAGMLWFTVMGPGTNPWAALLPAQLIAGIGLGLAFITVTVVGVRGVTPQDTGIAAGLVNTSQQVGGAIGLAALATIASAVTTSLLPGTALPDALSTGYAWGFVAGAALYLIALVFSATTLNFKVSGPQH